jgi:ABC-type dipeptide/oligopeptide/nickel transport system permease component
MVVESRGDMKRYIIRRMLWGIVVVWLVSVLIFSATRASGDPTIMMAAPGASEEELDFIRKKYGLDKPLPVQYVVFLSRALKGDFGKSLFYGVSASEVILDRLDATAALVGAAMAISLAIGVSGGLLAVTSSKKWVRSAVRGFSILGLSMPNFWIGLLALLVFSVYLEILPTSGSGSIWHLIMPAFSLGWYFSAGFLRITHSSLLEVMNQEYIKLSRMKGLPEHVVIGKHALKNALIPVVTLAGMNVVVMIGAAVPIETVFAWPGLGYLLYEAAINRDFNTVQGIVLLISVLMVSINLLVDIVYAYLDPRIRYT